MEELVPIIVVPTVLVLIFVAPIWIIMHYRSKNRAKDSLTAGEHAELESLAATAASMRERIETLESILDAETPDWRQRAQANE